MTVLFLDQYADPGGAQHCLLDVVQGARERGWKAFAALPEDGALSESLSRSGVPVSRIPCGPFSNGHKTGADIVRFAAQWPSLASRVSALLKACTPDVLYINGPRLVPAACAAAGRTVPVLFHCHSLLAPVHAWLVNQSLSLCARSAVIAGSRYVAAPLAGAKVIYNGVPDCSPPEPPPASACRRVGVIGRVSPEKGQLEFMQAARILARDMTDVRFVICGEPLFSNRAAADYYKAVREQSIGLPVEFLGWRQDVREALARMDVLVVPSPGPESTTRVILEAYSARVPVVAFRSGGIPEIVDDGVTGILVSPSTPESLAVTLRDALMNPASLRAMAGRARKRWERDFTVERFRQQVLETIEDLARSYAGRRELKPVAGMRERPATR